ncbi:MAG: AAC(3)-I family aminoglycoside N-acetyltransferase [Pseudomonadota bacterium]
MPAIKQLGPENIAAYRAMMRMFSEAFEDPENYEAAPPSDSYVRVLLGKAHFIALVAEEEGEVVGGIAAYELEKFEQERSEIYIYDLAVSQTHRRKGIATAMINHLRTLAAARGAWMVFVQADHGDDPAISLYQSLGLREEVLHFDISVAGPDRD